METNCINERRNYEFEHIFEKKEFKLKSVGVHALIYGIGLLGFILKEFYGIVFNFFPFKYLNFVVLVIWTSVFLYSVIDLFLSYKIFGDNWQERKAKSILEKKTKTQKWI